MNELPSFLRVAGSSHCSARRFGSASNFSFISSISDPDPGFSTSSCISGALEDFLAVHPPEEGLPISSLVAPALAPFAYPLDMFPASPCMLRVSRVGVNGLPVAAARGIAPPAPVAGC